MKKALIIIVTAVSIIAAVGCSKKNTRVLLGEEDTFQRLTHLFDKKDYKDFQEEARYFLSDFPGSKKSPQVQFLLGESYLKKKEYEEAIVSFQRVIDRYPESEYLDDAFFKIGETYYRQKRKPQRDQEATRRAIYYFEKVIDLNSPYSETAWARLEDCRNTLGMKEYYIARFYFRRKEYKISLAVIEKALKEFGETSAGNWLRYKQIRNYLALNEKDKAYSLYSYMTRQEIEDQKLIKKIRSLGDDFQEQK
ncbi:MAG TPA: outer membrane protein assembly factor BamD [Firmicutes bacterium]|nr:outer membrane protein assembly factor BamD [Bacillota bacterium]